MELKRMGMFTLLVVCLVAGLSSAQNISRYIHKFLGDGDKIEPEVNFLSHKYSKDQFRKWTMRAEHGVWALVFQKFAIELSTNCQHDYLQVLEINDRNQSAPIRPVRYCGETLPSPYVSDTPCLEVEFVSDDIWELDGFLIQIIHAENKEDLKTKMKPFVEIAAKAQAKSQSKIGANEVENVSQHPLFFTLIGCSIAALVIFGILLTYFVISIRKKEAELPSQAPQPFYISPASIITENRRTGMLPTPGSRAAAVCMTGKTGKRYSKDKANTARKFIVPKNNNVHHNNLYVSGNLSKNG